MVGKFASGGNHRNVRMLSRKSFCNVTLRRRQSGRTAHSGRRRRPHGASKGLPVHHISRFQVVGDRRRTKYLRWGNEFRRRGGIFAIHTKNSYHKELIRGQYQAFTGQLRLREMKRTWFQAKVERYQIRGHDSQARSSLPKDAISTEVRHSVLIS